MDLQEKPEDAPSQINEDISLNDIKTMSALVDKNAEKMISASDMPKTNEPEVLQLRDEEWGSKYGQKSNRIQDGPNTGTDKTPSILSPDRSESNQMQEEDYAKMAIRLWEQDAANNQELPQYSLFMQLTAGGSDFMADWREVQILSKYVDEARQNSMKSSPTAEILKHAFE